MAACGSDVFALAAQIEARVLGSIRSEIQIADDIAYMAHWPMTWPSWWPGSARRGRDKMRSARP